MFSSCRTHPAQYCGVMIRRGEADRLLRAAVDRSLARGVFGSPFFIVDGEPFFGLEKMELVDEWLASGGW